MSGKDYLFINFAAPTNANYTGGYTSSETVSSMSTDVFTESKKQKKKTTKTVGTKSSTKSSATKKSSTTKSTTKKATTDKTSNSKSGVKKKQTTKPRTTAERLHADWQTVLEVGAKTKHEGFKCDPNISKTFFNSVTDTAKRLNCNPDDLAAIMFLESHFDPKAKKGIYTGLIQIDKMSFDSIPDTKCSYSQYCRLPREKQLKYVEKYLKMRIDEQGLKGFLSGGQLYTLVRRPKAVHTRSEVKKNQQLVTDARKVPAKIKKEKEEYEKTIKSNSNSGSESKPKKLNVKT